MGSARRSRSSLIISRSPRTAGQRVRLARLDRYDMRDR